MLKHLSSSEQVHLLLCLSLTFSLHWLPPSPKSPPLRGGKSTPFSQSSQAPPVREGALWPSACLPNSHSPRLQLQALSKSLRKPLHPVVPRLSWIEIRARKLLLSQQRLAGRMERGHWRSGARTLRVGRDWLPGQGPVVAGHAKWDSLDNYGLRTVAGQETRG